MRGLGEKIYLNSPVWAQQVLIAVYGWSWYRRRFSSQFHHLVKEFRERENWQVEQFATYQEARLFHLLAFSRQAPYWAEAYRDVTFSPNIPIPEFLPQLPSLTKEALRTRASDLLTQKPPRGTMIQKSSGTTGTPTWIYYTPGFHALELAVPEARNLNWAGVNYRDRRVMFGVRKVCRFDQDTPPFWRFSPIEDMAYASIYHLSPEYLPHYISFLRDFHPAVIMGYPSALYSIAAHALETGDLPAPAKVVITTSETVSNRVRHALETAWGCKVFDRYGAVEACMFASQCEYGCYHVSPEVGIIEIVDEAGRPCPPGVMGEVICTGLQNMLQPLIRYRVGDVARWAVDQNCSCGRQMPILERIEGRFEDLCYMPDGRQMLRFDTVFKGVENIKEAQVVQEKLDLFTIYVVPTPAFDQADIEQIEHNMNLHVGHVTARIQPVTQIERSPLWQVPRGDLQIVCRGKIPFTSCPLMDRLLSIRDLTNQDLPEIVRVHQVAFPDSALTRLGSEVVSRYNCWLLEGPHDCLALGAFVRSVSEPERLAGFCFGGVFRQATLGFLRHNRAFLAWKIITNPWHLVNPLFWERFQGVGNAWLKRRRRPSFEPIIPSPLPSKSFGILSIAVRPEFQRKGIGQKLITQSEALAMSIGFSNMHLTVHPENVAVVSFYKQMGFKCLTGPDPWTGYMSKCLPMEINDE